MAGGMLWDDDYEDTCVYCCSWPQSCSGLADSEACRAEFEAEFGEERLHELELENVVEDDIAVLNDLGEYADSDAE